MPKKTIHDISYNDIHKQYHVIIINKVDKAGYEFDVNRVNGNAVYETNDENDAKKELENKTKEISQSNNHKQICMLMYFPNDTHGHSTGDGEIVGVGKNGKHYIF